MEKIKTTLNSQGDIIDCDIWGSLSIKINNPSIWRFIL